MRNEESIKAGVTQVAQEIFDDLGEIPASELVERARDPKSPAHAGFEWDDGIAAHEHRLWQARQWCRKIEVVVEHEPERLINIPLRVVYEESKEGSYKPLSVVVKKADEYTLALSFAHARLAAAQRAIDELIEAAEKTGRTTDRAVIAQFARSLSDFRDGLLQPPN